MGIEYQNNVNEKISFYKFVSSLSLLRLLKNKKAGLYTNKEFTDRLLTAISSALLSVAVMLGFLSIFLLMWCDAPNSCQYNFLGIGVKSLPLVSFVGGIILISNYYVMYKNKQNLILIFNFSSVIFSIILYVLLASIAK